MGRIRVMDTDPVQFLISWLDENLPEAVTIGDDRDSDSLPYVTVRSDGGSQQLHWTASSSIGINVWHHSEKQAQDLALLVRSWVEFATNNNLCQLSTCSMPIEVTDNSGSPRRYLTAQITLSQRVPA